MNRLYYISSLVIAMLMVASCCEKLPDIQPSPSENDSYAGKAVLFRLGQEAESFNIRNVRCWMRTESGEKIMRTCEHIRERDSSTVRMKIGLKDGIYRLLYFEYEIPDGKSDDGVTTRKFGLGGRIAVNKGSVRGIDKYDPIFGMSG